MSTPTKKRKTNYYKASPKTVGSLDFFFAKTKDGLGSDKRDANHVENEKVDCAVIQAKSVAEAAERKLTDEELARKLQNEWDEQDKLRGRTDTGEADKAVIGASGNRKVDGLSLEDSLRVQPPLNLNGKHQSVQTQEHRSNLGRVKRDTLSLQSTASADITVSSTVPFDESPLTFDPSKYVPDLKKQWAELGGDASYDILTRCFILVNSTQSRIKIVDTLVNFLRTLIESEPESLLPAVSTAPNILIDFAELMDRCGSLPMPFHRHMFR